MKSIFLPPSPAHLFTVIGNSDSHKIFPIPSPSYYSAYLPVHITFHSSFTCHTPHFILFSWPSQNLYPILNMWLIRLLFKNRSCLIPSSGKKPTHIFTWSFILEGGWNFGKTTKLWCKIFISPGFCLLLTQQLLSVSCSEIHQLFPGKLLYW